MRQKKSASVEVSLILIMNKKTKKAFMDRGRILHICVRAKHKKWQHERMFEDTQNVIRVVFKEQKRAVGI